MPHSIIVDLDGPVLDGVDRHYSCYGQILTDYGFEPIPPKAYWDLKRRRTDRRTVLELSDAGDSYDAFAAEWLARIESRPLLELDRLQLGARERLTNWRDSGHRLILATMRHSPSNLYWQLDKLKLTQLFDLVVVSNHLDGGFGKAQGVLRAHESWDPHNCVWIGDTEVDIEASRHLHVESVALTCGLRTEDFLRSLNPDVLADRLENVDLQTIFPPKEIRP